MAADCGWHNTLVPEDVDGDRVVAALDALLVINRLNVGAGGDLCSRQLDGTGEAGEDKDLVDVSGNGFLEPRDVLLVINQLNIQADTARRNSAKSAALTSQLNVAESLGAQNLLTPNDVQTLLKRASQVSQSQDAIIAVVDRSGRILGVRVESGVSPTLTAPGREKELAFAIDGAVAKARTAAFFSNNQAPLTSRTIRFISQSTITQREVQSSPQNEDLHYRGPGLVAPIGVGGHFPPEIPFTPQVDLFAIEHQSRDSKLMNGLDGVRGTMDDVELVNRFNVHPLDVAVGAEQFFETWPESYGVVTKTAPAAQARGIATLPGGVPLFKVVTDANGVVQQRPNKSLALPDVNLVGGIGVFFPGPDGFATHEQGFVHASERGGVAQTEAQRTNSPRVLESETIAFLAAAGGGIVGPSAFVRDLSAVNAKLTPLPNFFVPAGRIDLVGITLEIFGPSPTTANPIPGSDTLLNVSRSLGIMSSESGHDYPVTDTGTLYLAGQAVPERWLVVPHDSSDGKLKADDVEQMIYRAIAQADLTRAAIRLDLDRGFRPGARTRMVISVADTNGEVLGVYRMPDATIFSIDVSIAKARNTAYYADAGALQDADRVDFDSDGIFGSVTTSLVGGDTLPLGTALTNRTFRFLAEPRYPTGINIGPAGDDGLVNDPARRLADQRPDTSRSIGPHSMLQLPGINPLTAENLENIHPLSFNLYASPESSSTVAFDSFRPSRNFRDMGDGSVKIAGTDTYYPLANQNGVVFFPGSTPLYVAGTDLAGGFGVSGDGVDQDDVVTALGQVGFAPPDALRVDQYSIGGVRLPFQKYNRNPNGL